jgi:hypothetical protein
MALPSPFTLPHSQFNEFLFALIGKEGNGMPLSVISALARLEVDPWQEAARLADLPKELAPAALDGLLRRLPAGGWDPAETPSIVARLIALLPRRDVGTRTAEARPGRTNTAKPPAILWLLIAVLGAVILLSVLAHGAQQASDRGASTALTNAVRSAAEP